MIENKDLSTWCVNADHAMSGNNTGTTKICCMYRKENLKHSLGVDPIVINFTQKDFNVAREELANGIRHKPCMWCFEEEDAGRKSKRQRDNEKYFTWLKQGNKPFEGLAKFELNLGNTCNLKCRTCAPHSSSTWMEEYYDVYEKNRYPTYKLFAQEMKKYHQHYDDESPFWDDLEQNLSTIKQFDFYGGEPFMSKKMWRILEVAVEKGYAGDMEIHYATNGTHWPAEKIEIFRHFRHVHLSFSIDGIGDQFEYMRFPAKWNEVTENMRRAVEFNERTHNLYLGWCITLSSINITALPDILTYHKQNFPQFGPYLNLVHGPIWYNLNQMPERYKGYVIDRLQGIDSSMADPWMLEHHIPGIVNYIKNGQPQESNWQKFLEYTRTHDEYRNQRFNTVFPEFAKVIGYE